jgi:hypothetical protein
MSNRAHPTVALDYPSAPHGRIPAFQNVEEEAAFWETHDITDDLDDLEPVTLRVSPTFASDYRVTVGLDQEEREEVERQAAAQGVGPATVVQRLVKEQLKPKTTTKAEASG